ncbi:MAG: filamentous hemagglutinin N-terminal domain-containing protein, partial [Xenococcus sp. (in: cyanobacteria)]
MKQRLSLLLSLSCLTLSQGIFLRAATAQVTPDGTTNTTVDVSGNDFTINNGDRAGGNLFHSFGEFSVPTNGSAFFDNPLDIVNIFSRVTGGNISNIDGLLGANGAANLFMINPAGIIFGENASLNIGGSFYGSTADSIVFSNGEFSATDLANPPLITINAPLGLGIRDHPGDIVNRSAADGVGLSVNEGQSISLIGGNVNIQNGGIVFALGGRVELGGLTEAGTVNFNDDGSLTFPDGIARGNVSITESSTVAVFSGDGGSIGVNANNFKLSSGSNIFGGIAAGRGSVGAQAGDIVINATESVLIDGQGDLNTGISVGVFANSIGNAGNIDITTGSLTVNNAALDSNNSGQGDAGNISIAVSDEFTANNGSLITSNIGSPIGEPALGRVGNIEITARKIAFDNGANIQAGAFSGATAEDSGTVSLTATESISFKGNTAIFSNNASSSFGNASDTQLSAPTVTIQDGALITTSNSGQGDAASIAISTDNFLIDGGRINTTNSGQGDAGNISIA